MHHVTFLIVCLAWGSGFYLMKLARQAFGPISVGAYRVALAALFIAVWWSFNRRKWPIRGRLWGHVFVVVCTSFIFPFCMQPYLIGKYDASGFVGMMVSLVPLMTILVSIVMLGVHPTRRQVTGVCGGLVCFVLVFYDGATVRKFSMLDLSLAALVPLCYAVANTYIKKNLGKVPATELTLSSMSIASVILLPVALATEPVQTGEGFGLALGSLIVFGLLCTGLATVLFYKLIHDRGPLYAGMVTYVIPVIALAVGAAVGKETLTAVQIIALSGILAMVMLVQSGEIKSQISIPKSQTSSNAPDEKPETTP